MSVLFIAFVIVWSFATGTVANNLSIILLFSHYLACCGPLYGYPDRDYYEAGSNKSKQMIIMVAAIAVYGFASTGSFVLYQRLFACAALLGLNIMGAPIALWENYNG